MVLLDIIRERGFVMINLNEEMIDLEEAVVRAIEDGGECYEDVLAHVKTNFSPIIDELHVADMYSDFCGDWMSEAYA